VKKPFTSKASFDFELFKKHAGAAQRIMDDIIDLELEKIDMILNKIKSDPEELEVKDVEIKLWKKIRQKCIEGRRTGIGITAEGDMLAALGLRYGTQPATDFSVKVHKTLALEVYRSSALMLPNGEVSPYMMQNVRKTIHSLTVLRMPMPSYMN
jgi:ribonucleoside-diphosphate reductase alpha chain